MAVRREIPTEDLKRIHVALDQMGTIGGAAAVMGVSETVIRNAIKTHPELQSYLPQTTLPLEVETIARKPLPIDAGHADTLAAVKAADAQVRAGFESIGVEGEALTQAMAFKEFGRLHFQSMRHYISGGVAKLFADLMAEIKEVNEDIARGTDLEHEIALREDRSRLVKLTIDVYDRVREASLTAATIEAKKKEAQDARKKSRPAFTPLAMNVHGNVTVNEAKAGGQVAQPPSVSGSS